MVFELSELGHAAWIVGLNAELEERLAGTPHFCAEAVGRERCNLDPIEPDRSPVSNLTLKRPRLLVNEQSMPRRQSSRTSLELLGQIG
jgi:hypothetical protein